MPEPTDIKNLVLYDRQKIELGNKSTEIIQNNGWFEVYNGDKLTMKFNARFVVQVFYK